MTRILAGIASFCLLAGGAPAAVNSPLEGRWKKGNLEIEIAPCGRTLCGTVVKASTKQRARARRGSGTDLIGATLIKDIQPTGPGIYRASVFVADRNVHARGTIRILSPDTLSVRGCVFAILCKSQKWQRVVRQPSQVTSAP